MSIGYDQLNKNAYHILAMPMMSATGNVSLLDMAKPHHPITQTGTPTWAQLPSGLWWLTFNPAHPDFLQIPAAVTDLNLISADFGIGFWWSPTSAVTLYRLICRGLASTDGYYISQLASGAIEFATNQAAAQQLTQTAGGAVVATTPAFWLISRKGASVRIYKNGYDFTSVVGNHVNPLTSARKFHVGIYDDEASNPVAGNFWQPRVWSGYAPTEYDARITFEMERKWFGI